MRYLFTLRCLYYLFLAGSIAACASNPEIITKEVKVLVSVPCHVEVPYKPVMPLDSLQASEDDIFRIVKNSLAEIELRKGYELKLEAAVESCNTASGVVGK